jgi:glycosyltransferase involved in cell wall biosynthesis
MRIAIATTGRFHVLDLSRELSALGHEVRFYSYVPRKRAEQFGLSSRCHRNLLPFVWPLIMLRRKGPLAWAGRFDALLQKTIDGLIARFLERCDVFIGMSGLCVRSAQVARHKYGAKVFLERGSRHILSQKEILEAIPGISMPAVPEFDIHRELWGYEFADVVSIPSRHVECSFSERGYPKEKLFRNSYGVDLSMFPPTKRPQSQTPTLVFAGTWSLRKGSDVLTKAIEGQPWRLIHVGAVGDMPLPKLPNFESRGVVPQSRLSEAYAMADAFVLPSREDGFGVVLCQALACGMPLVCTDRTGGEDLAEILDDRAWVTVVQPDDAAALRRGIEQALAKATKQSGQRDIMAGRRDCFSWRSYAKRYDDELRRRTGAMQ